MLQLSPDSACFQFSPLFLILTSTKPSIYRFSITQFAMQTDSLGELGMIRCASGPSLGKLHKSDLACNFVFDFVLGFPIGLIFLIFWNSTFSNCLKFC